MFEEEVADSRPRPRLLVPLAILVATSLASSASSGFAETLRVTSDHNTIQKAIDAASDGDTILVDPDFNYENIDFLGKAITLKSTDGPEVTTIDGSFLTRGRDFGSVVSFTSGEGPDSVLDGFTITGGIGTVFSDLYGPARFGG